MLLTDANILLEVLLNRAKAADARRLLDEAPFAMAVTDFAFHSVCVHLGRSRRPELYPVLASLFRRRLDVVSLTLSETLVNVPGAMRKHGLDFDDAYQYTAAEDRQL